MNIDLYYPHNIKFYDYITLINIKFINNENTVMYGNYVNNNSGKLATILPQFSKREYQYKDSIVAIFYITNLKRPYRIVKLIVDYIYNTLMKKKIKLLKKEIIKIHIFINLKFIKKDYFCKFKKK